MDNEEREFHAREIINNPLFRIITDKMESDAVNKAVNAPLTDHDTRQAAIAELRAVRTFRRECESIIRTKPVPKAAPA